MATPLKQLQAMRSLPENWDGYGAAVPQQGVIDLAQEFTGYLEVAFQKFHAGFESIHVHPTRAGGVLLQWEDPVMEHEIEINSDHSISFLHLLKATGKITTRKFSPGPRTVVDAGLLQELRQLLAAAACRKRLALLFQFVSMP